MLLKMTRSDANKNRPELHNPKPECPQAVSQKQDHKPHLQLSDIFKGYTIGITGNADDVKSSPTEIPPPTSHCLVGWGILETELLPQSEQFSSRMKREIVI